MGYLTLAGTDWQRITTALETGFGVVELSRLVSQQFPGVAREVSWLQGQATVVHEVVQKSNQQGVLDQVLVAIITERPSRPDLRSLGLYYAQRPGWAAPMEAAGLDVGHALERLTITGDPFLDTTLLARWLIGVERQVCQVRCGQGYGTGFLVAPDLVLTCFHVVESHLAQQVPLAEVAVRFDYRRTRPGSEPPDTPAWVGLDAHWTIPHAPYSATADWPVGIQNKLLPEANELDYALLKLQRAVGREPPAGEHQPRGWVDLSADLSIPVAQTPVLIVQHPGRDPRPPADKPQQEPLQIAFATPGFEALNANQTRIAYTPSTRPGSSGSPVFDGSLRPVALHHNLGQIHPEMKQLVKNNRGIPLVTIRAALDEQVRQLLVAPPQSG